jgi:hypothetical protein
MLEAPTTATRSLTEVVNDLRQYCTSVLAPPDQSLTSLQQEARLAVVSKGFAAVGIQFERWYNDGNPKVTFKWTPGIVVLGTGRVTDVSAAGHFPISVEFAERVTVRVEPRLLGNIDQSDWSKLGNREFGHLQKGCTYEFEGEVRSCAYYYSTKEIANGRFEFYVEKQGRGGQPGFLQKWFRSFFGG